MQAIPVAFNAGKKGNAMLWRYFPGRNRVDGIYDSLLARARLAHFYRGLGVADTRDGRFDLLTLHAWLVLQRLQLDGKRALAKRLTDRIFSGFEAAMREDGATDGGVFRGLKLLAAAFYGRLEAYTVAAMDGQEALTLVIARNLFRRDVPDPVAREIAAYMLAARIRLADWTPGGELPLDFGPLPD